ncbi:MAG: 2-hydroxyacyl-CoA dehydratase family protein, partial [Spirochaetota bacterium]
MSNAQATASNKKPKGLRSRYYNQTGIARHREWRGFRDTMYHYFYWLKNLNSMTIFVVRYPIRALKGMWKYRWMGSYLSTFAFVDRCLEGYRGQELRVGNMHLHAIIHSVTKRLPIVLRADERLGKNPYSKKMILHDTTMPPLFLAGFKNLTPMQIQLFNEFLICNMDQQLMPHYIDALESFGVPADLCSKNVAESGVASEDDYPQYGVCALTSNMACDGSIITSSFQARRIQKPTFPVMMPMRHTEDEVHGFTEDQLRGAIKFVEEQTGEKYDWNTFYKRAAVLNTQNECELAKWDL